MASSLDPAGEVTASALESNVSKIQLAQSQIMMQSHFLREEISTDAKAKKDGGGGGGAPGAGGGKNTKKDKKNNAKANEDDE